MKCKSQPLLGEGYEREYGLRVNYISGHYGLFDKDGRMLLPCAYDQIEHFDDWESAWVCYEGLWGMVDTRGKFRFKPQYPQKGFFVDNACWVKRQDGAWGRIDHDNHIVTPFIYAGHHSVLAVLVVEQDKHFGAIDAQGHLVLPFEYTKIEEVQLEKAWDSCSQGCEPSDVFMAIAYQDKDMWILDREGHIRFNEPFCSMYCSVYCSWTPGPHTYDFAFHDDLMLIAKRKDSTIPYDKHDNWLVGLYDVRKEEFLLPCVYDQIAEYSHGKPWLDRTPGNFTLARREGKEVLLDHTGRETMPLEYEVVDYRGFYDGEYLIPAYKDKLWGYINVHGTVKIPFRFKWAGQFYHGVAPVRYASVRDGVRLDDYTEDRMEVRYIDHHGREAQAPDHYPDTIY